MNKNSWRDRLYASYVSSGQAQLSTARNEAIFASRKPYIERIISHYVSVAKDTPILDLGCGCGAFIHFLRRNGYLDVTGIDISQEQVDVAHQLRIDGVTQGDLLECLQQTKTDSVGVVLLMDILEHMTRAEAFPILDEVLRVMAPGGKCLIHVPNAEGIFGMRIRYGDITHEQSFTPSSVRQLLNTTGFQQITIYEEKPILHGWKSSARRLIWELGTVSYRLLLAAETGTRGCILSQNMLVIVRKPRDTARPSSVE